MVRVFRTLSTIYRVSSIKVYSNLKVNIPPFFFQRKSSQLYKYNTIMSVILIIISFCYQWPSWEKLLNFTYSRVFFGKFNTYFKQTKNKASMFKGTLTQIWKSACQYLRFDIKICWNFILKHLLLFEICARQIREKFVYKHSKTIE